MVRIKIGPPLINRLHVPPFFIHILIERDQPVVSPPEKESNDENDKENNDEQPAATDREFIHKIENISATNRSGNRWPSQPGYRPRTRRRKEASANFARIPR